MNDWIEFNGPFSSYEDGREGLSQALGGYENLVGLLVETADGKRYLIGDVNGNGGVCDCCCCELRGYEIVTRYMRVWQPPARA